MPTLEGKAKLAIPSGTQFGKVFKLKNKGIQILGSNRRGDQHVQVLIRVPNKISEEHRETLEKLREIEGEDTTDSKGFFDKFKEFFA